MKTRPEHFRVGDDLIESGNMWWGGSLRDENNKMIGSVLMMNFPSRKELDKWLEREPYVTEKVWEKIEIQRCHSGEPWQFSKPEKWFREAGYLDD